MVRKNCHLIFTSLKTKRPTTKYSVNLNCFFYKISFYDSLVTSSFYCLGTIGNNF